VSTLLPMVSLLVVVALALLVTRIGTVALTFTGLSRELARFQARSAFTGVGFTTSESERILEHPVRRRIIMLLMLLGNAGFIAAVSSMLPVFIDIESGGRQFLARLLILVSGLLLLWALSVSKWVDRWLSRIIEYALKRWTHLDVWDYSNLLHLATGYSVSEVEVEEGDWVADRNLAEIRLGDEGVQVLGIRRTDGKYIGAPTGKTVIHAGDTLVVYGKSEQLAELGTRRAGTTGDRAHEERVAELQQTLILQDSQALAELRKKMAETETDENDDVQQEAR